MKVVIPYTNLRADCRLSVISDGYEPILLETFTGEDYWKVLFGLWEQRESFILVEGDIVVFPNALKELEKCSHDWCARPYYINGKLKPSFGCVKFTKEFILKYPMLIHNIPENEREWWQQDMAVYRMLKELGEEVHLHYPAVTHLNILHQPSRERYGI